MSVENFLNDVVHLNLTHALERLKDYWNSIQPEIKALEVKFASDAGKIVWSAGTIALQDLASGKTVSQAAADAWEPIKDQVPNMALQDLEDAIGIQKRAQ